MAIKVTASSIMTRGMGGLSPSQFKELLDNADRVDAIIKEIDERRTICIDAEASAKARLVDAEKADEDLKVREAALAKERASLEASAAEAEAKQQGGTEALTKLTRSVSINEAAVDKRALALDDREKQMNEAIRVREDELQSRESEIERADRALEKGQEDLHKHSTDLEATRARLDTTISLMKKAVQGLG